MKYLTSKRLGFGEPKEELNLKLFKKFEKQRTLKLKESKNKWHQYFIENGGKNEVIKKNSTLKEIIRNYGIPTNFRPKIWFEMSGDSIFSKKKN